MGWVVYGELLEVLIYLVLFLCDECFPPVDVVYELPLLSLYLYLESLFVPPCFSELLLQVCD